GLRTMATCTMLGSWMSSVYVPDPVISRGSSLRLSRAPMPATGTCVTPSPAASIRGRASLLQLAGGVLHRPDDVVVARAAAEDPFQPAADLLLRRVGVDLQEVRRGHDHARRAEAALQPVLLPEPLLHRVEPAVAGEPLDGHHLAAVGLDRQHRAR